MITTYSDFGDYIRKMRENKGLTQSEFIDEMNRISGRIQDSNGNFCLKNGKKTKSIINRSTLSGIENGNEKKIDNMTFEQLKTMSLVFGRWIGALLGEYTCRTYDNQFINSCTGLSDESIEIIRREKDYAESGKYNEFVYMINEIICNNSSFNTGNSLFFNIMECCYLNYGIKKSQKLEMDNCDASKDDNLHKATVESRKLYDLKVFETMEIFKHTLDATAEKTSNYLIDNIGL